MNMTTTTTRADKRTVTKAGRVIVHGRSGTSATFGAVEFVPVPGHEMGKLIGRGRRNLASIQDKSGVVRIEVNDRRGGLELFGGVTQVRAAAALIERQLPRQARRESSASVAVSDVSEPDGLEVGGAGLWLVPAEIRRRKPAPKTAAKLAKAVAAPSAWDFPVLAPAAAAPKPALAADLPTKSQQQAEPQREQPKAWAKPSPQPQPQPVDLSAVQMTGMQALMQLRTLSMLTDSEFAAKVAALYTVVMGPDPAAVPVQAEPTVLTKRQRKRQRDKAVKAAKAAAVAGIASGSRAAERPQLTVLAAAGADGQAVASG